ncbi:hypothetical protein BGZ80_009387 [Entomortierella chlamydospora]|uniref:Peptidase A1 domain-containing protein n=1 Tax=Entomortierella chlamydospora TaxID=101097 RepID=A0A9P6T0N9_9FUNG|nr:hypothetical protein BGZ79_009532 [Entomortierella chlamydospora]KAG0016165.1 hypothetical protein BGZ80_009387 [Entomortierella chlamydospora]
MVKILPILLLSIACVFAAPTPKTSVKLPLKAPQSRVAYHHARSRDHCRWSHLSNNSTNSTLNIPAINADVSYLITVGLGTPAQNVDLIFDTGSSDLWVQSANYDHTQSSSSKDLKETFSIQYGSGSTSGKEFSDQVTIGGFTFTQEFGVASQATGFNGIQGLVGFGPDDLSAITSNGENIPTPTDNLYTSGQISSDVIGVFFKSITDGGTQETNGEITFGGVDATKFTGSITYVPVTTVSPASQYWGIDVSSITYGTSKVSSTTHGIVDTGTTLILLSDSSVKALYKNIRGAALDNNSGLYTIPSSQVSKLNNITFTIGGTDFTLTPAQYLVPDNQVANQGGVSGTAYSWIGSLGSNESGLAFILGQKFLENYYSVYDTTNNRVGLAPLA